jgi:hypothetical protein
MLTTALETGQSPEGDFVTWLTWDSRVRNKTKSLCSESPGMTENYESVLD